MSKSPKGLCSLAVTLSCCSLMSQDVRSGTLSQSVTIIPSPITRAENRRGDRKDAVASDLEVLDWLEKSAIEDLLRALGDLPAR